MTEAGLVVLLLSTTALTTCDKKSSTLYMFCHISSLPHTASTEQRSPIIRELAVFSSQLFAAVTHNALFSPRVNFAIQPPYRYLPSLDSTTRQILDKGLDQCWQKEPTVPKVNGRSFNNLDDPPLGQVLGGNEIGKLLIGGVVISWLECSAWSTLPPIDDDHIDQFAAVDKANERLDVSSLASPCSLQHK